MLQLTAFISGVVFALGLILSGMTQPEKIIRFLDIAGSWDPTLAFVMGGALAVYMPAYHFIKIRNAPILDTKFHISLKTDIDKRLMIGSAIFGLGWGLAGYCPAPAITSLSTLSSSAIVVVVGMVVGIFIARKLILPALK